MNEFALIKRFFLDQVKPIRHDVALGIGDDCALLKVPAGQLLAVSIDTSVAGVHFPLSTSAHAIGHKSLAVSLSDLAAMGAEPAWITIAATIPTADETWIQAFAEGFFTLANRHKVSLVGGDTTKGPLAITTQVHGFVPKGLALCRKAAKVGDGIFVTGSIGDAGLGLAITKGQYAALSQAEKTAMLNRLNYPTPRLEAGLALRGVAHAAIDLSDGLAGDLGHILEQSQVGACIELSALPIASTLKSVLIFEQAWQLALSAGDDYELCFTAPREQFGKIQQISQSLSLPITQIGVIEEATGLRGKLPSGEIINLNTTGYQHF